jgi:hypothetical protein
MDGQKKNTIRVYVSAVLNKPMWGISVIFSRLVGLLKQEEIKLSWFSDWQADDNACWTKAAAERAINL